MRWMVLGGLALSGAATAQMSPPVPPAEMPNYCAAPEHRQLDFWIGEWTVMNTENPEEMRGVNLIESVYFGCALRETWSPFTMLRGGSLTAYDRREKLWRQSWVDASGTWTELKGGLVDGRMVLTSADRAQRLTMYPEKGTVRQIGARSADGGKSWQQTFDFTYKPRKPQP